MQFTKPTNFNADELKTDLETAGINVERITIEADGQISMDIAAKDLSKATLIIAAHNGSTATQELSIDQKLAAVGLSITDLKAALGI